VDHAVVGPFMYIALIRLNKQYVREERAFEAVEWAGPRP